MSAKPDAVGRWVASTLTFHKATMDPKTVRDCVVNVSEFVLGLSDFANGAPIHREDIARCGGKVIDDSARVSEDAAWDPGGRTYTYVPYSPEQHLTAVITCAIVTCGFLLAIPPGDRWVTRQQLNDAYNSICQALYMFEGAS